MLFLCSVFFDFTRKSFKDPLLMIQKLISRIFFENSCTIGTITGWYGNLTYLLVISKWTWVRSLDDFSLWILENWNDYDNSNFTFTALFCSRKLFVYFHQKLSYRVRYVADADANLLSFQLASSKKENKNITFLCWWFTILKWLVNKLLVVRHFSWLKLFEIQHSTFEESSFLSSCGLGKIVFTDCFLGIRQNKSSIFCTPPLSKNWNRLADEKTVVSVGCHCAWQFSLTSVQMYIVYTF